MGEQAVPAKAAFPIGACPGLLAGQSAALDHGRSYGLVNLR